MARSTDIDEVPTPIGRAPAFLGMLDQVSRLAPLRRPVLVIGERGTGKELVAARLALLSDRWDRPLVKLNCAALPEALLDSELFGHEAGAFTGAQKRRLSRFERADGGTMFLDEIGTASQAVQEKLLRVIEYGSFERVGGSETIRVDVRLIGATNADLPAMAREGRFRADLLDRLAFDVVNIPPLRARPEDISLLAEHFATRMSAELGRKMFAGFTERALERLQAYDWPGNVRELRNVVERSVYRMDRPEKALDEIVLDPFVMLDWKEVQAQRVVPAVAPVVPAGGETLTFPRDFGADVRTHERALLEAALREAQFSQRRAAELLGLTYYQFRHHLRLHGLADKEARKALGVKE
ncbi:MULTISPECIES: phage shock protein operon transcriptional activator [Gluconobacter]|uniref:Phage shock protein operon transcriptional activator n=1 Tax=Gluconobacter cadivus TaxID=2728101 RepID=A0ABR9YRW9_9PROT|nr:MULTISPECIES: phage shock protein operon transcriptional activator [Gluconobacter]MBF0887079.1 phage shock protein operon transcriptional activator [Gluconobacter cadivus]MBS1059148.1 phage shock protein operon transcriptional activator [Gluconobacter sp. Dm-44]